MPLDANNGESSTPEELNAATDAALAANDFTKYVEAENARETGKALAEAPPADSKKTSEQTAASETAIATEVQEKPKPKTGEDRKIELAAEIKELLKQRAELQGKTPEVVKVAEPAPAVVKPATEATNEAPKKPKLEDFQTFAAYDEANDKYLADLVSFKTSEAIAANDTKRAEQAIQKQLSEKWEASKAAARELYPDFEAVAFNAETPITPVMDGFLKDSDDGPGLLYKLGENGSAEGKRIAALSPFAAVRALVALEAGTAAAAPVVKVPIIPVKKHTAAPPPPTNLAGKASETGDSSVAAIASGDFANYMARENAREIKAAR